MASVVVTFRRSAPFHSPGSVRKIWSRVGISIVVGEQVVDVRAPVGHFGRGGEGRKNKAGQAGKAAVTGELCDSEVNGCLPRLNKHRGLGIDSARATACVNTEGKTKAAVQRGREGRSKKTRKHSRDAILLAVYSSNTPRERWPRADQAVARDEKEEKRKRARKGKGPRGTATKQGSKSGDEMRGRPPAPPPFLVNEAQRFNKETQE